MTFLRRLCRYPLCCIGMHVAPAHRHPHGPIVADCPVCSKTCYFYGLSAYGLGGPPVLMAAPPRKLVKPVYA